ncbi:hypothetical protein LTR12_001393 [Friedmanniomyces endolithicus]|nr:hypothetical protein LTR74_000253 [Friedmanniomyces endolithicus]KAK1824092.1 hypothetical protein LTR12_001393 [Friedmanniomyces endolithicus]
MTTPEDKLEANLPPIIIDDEQLFPLFRLPPELWAKIGKEVIDATPKVRGWSFAKRIELSGGYHRDASKTLCSPAITRTCRVLRAELLPQFYASCIRFNFYFPRDSLDGPIPQNLLSSPVTAGKCAWLRSIGPANRRCLTEVAFCCDPSRLQAGLRDLRGLLGSGGVPVGVELSNAPKEAEYAYECAEILEMYGRSLHPLVFT